MNTLEISDSELEAVLKLLKNHYGYDFYEYSKGSLKRRIIRYLGNNRLKNISELTDDLLNHENSFVDFLQNITVNVTEMFRDPAFFRALQTKVFPILSSYPYLKIWHAGCSTGEEVYSLAILLKEHDLLERTKIYATDINPKVLNWAKQGIFPLKYMKEYTYNYTNAGGKEEFSNYYTAKYDHAIFDSELRKNMVFSLHNLVSDHSFNEFNLILCRNVLIYFERPLQNRVVNLFVNSLCMFGYLALGSKESLITSSEKRYFQTEDNINKIFKRIK